MGPLGPGKVAGMREKSLEGKRHGMAVLILWIALMALLWIALMALAVTLMILAMSMGTPEEPYLPLFLPAMIWIMGSWILIPGLKVLKPQEALVLTLFGKYIGTLKGEGFYYVNPFCTAVNPAAKTKLGQSGDGSRLFRKQGEADPESRSKKISLKAMTLSNAKQKVNDVLGNPVEISVAIIWRVQDTAKAVFEVDNYKEYLSLQADAAVRDIVKIYPYDVSIPPGMARRMTGAFAVPPRWWQSASGT